MRRSNRNIETFDISLMAVVTKAMGAFLVLMLLLMPYYSSGPIGQQAVSDLAKKVDQIDQKIKDVIDKLTKASPEDLRKQLEEALKLLDEARKLIAELKRANDALQAQVKRLEERVASLTTQLTILQTQIATLQQENASLRRQVTSLQNELEAAQQTLKQYKGHRLWATVSGMECKELISLELYKHGIEVYKPDGKPSQYLLNYNGITNETVESQNFSMVVGGGLTPGNYAVVLRVLSPNIKAETLKDGMLGVKLKKATADCHGGVGLAVTDKDGKGWRTGGTVEVKQGNTSLLMYAVTLEESGFVNASKETRDQIFQWWWENNNNAEKLD